MLYRSELTAAVQAYMAVPPLSTPTRGRICYMPDLFGIYDNSQLVADDFASNGYVTVILDIFLGEAMPPGIFSNPEFDVMKWIASNQPRKVDPVWSALTLPILQWLNFSLQ
jgi:dienelactone hydrolase